MRHLIDPLDFTLEETLRLMDLADRIHDDPAAYQDVAARKRLASLFYEPSTRTRLSFESAMLNLGGQVIGFPDGGVSSASKGETVADTIRIVSCYANIAAMRHPKEGAPLRAARYSGIPVINAGDGGHSHPTQTLLDMMTIRRRKGRLDGLTNRFLRRPQVRPHGPFADQEPFALRRHAVHPHQPGRAARARLYHQRSAGAARYPLPGDAQPGAGAAELDILYMTRVQRERFFNEEDYIRLKNQLCADQVQAGPGPARHGRCCTPLPRVNEITLDVDDDPRAAYFEQAQNGVYMRMALIMTLLGLKDPKTGEVAFEC